MMTPVGASAGATAAAVRAGISRIRDLPIRDTHFRPYRGASVPEEVLLPAPDGTGLPGRLLRLLRLSIPALREAAGGCGRPVTLLLGLPDDAEPRFRASFFSALAQASEVPLDLSKSQCFAGGRAAGLLAMRHGARMLSSGDCAELVVGGVDCLTDPVTLLRLEDERRLPRRHGPSDALHPGEAAAFMTLAVRRHAARRSAPALACVASMGMGHEPGHLSSREPHRGEGLTQAFRTLFGGLPRDTPPVRCVYAGFTGERYFAMEWGMASLRTRQYLAEEVRMVHPAESMGDVGAAQGPLMVGLAARGLHKQYREGPILVWSSSDRAERAAVLLRDSMGQG
ncbi:hypothetical protein JKA73_36315 [Myxococcus xanthus]|nr:hypothetical protein JKA73_36315 [Myxococcus xanthus]